jgi:predicted nicotinamide N-methyase
MEQASPQSITDKSAFIRANTRLRPVPLTPEISLFVADEAVPLWHKTEEELGEAGLPPPFWAFAWAGGQALARYVLDNADLVRGRTVLDLASGSGLVGIAAMKAGAAAVTVADIDPFACAAAALNAENGVIFATCDSDLLAAHNAGEWDVVLAGDIFYERDTAQRAFDFLSGHAARGAS